MSKGTYVTEKTFRAIKILLQSDETQKNIADYMGVSVITVRRIKGADTFEEYKANRNAWLYKKKAEAQKKAEAKKAEVPQIDPNEVYNSAVPMGENKQVIEHKQSITIQATHYMMTELQKTNEYLKLISNKLAFIVDELTGPVRKEG